MKKVFFVFSFGLLGLQSCKEIMATDISETIPVLILPQSNDTISNNPVHFKWEEVNGATKYHLQIVSPSFQNIQEFTIDSMVSTNSIFISLDSAKYELMLTALNEGYESHTLGPIPFCVGVQPTTSSQIVQLVNPFSDQYVNETFDLNFSWSPLSGYQTYEYSIRKGTSYSSSNIIETVAGIYTNSYQLSQALMEGEYHWGVKAYTASGDQTIVSTNRLYVDTTNPVLPQILSPTGSVNTGQVTFVWSNGNDNGIILSPITSYIEVSNDANFIDIVSSTQLIGSTTDITLTGIGQRYWRVKNIDAAGNTSGYSQVAQFTLF